MQQQRKLNGVGRRVESDQEGVAGRFDFQPTGEQAEGLADDLMMLIEEGGGGPIAEALLERGGPHRVGKEQGHQTTAMSAVRVAWTQGKALGAGFRHKVIPMLSGTVGRERRDCGARSPESIGEQDRLVSNDRCLTESWWLKVVLADHFASFNG